MIKSLGILGFLAALFLTTSCIEEPIVESVQFDLILNFSPDINSEDFTGSTISLINSEKGYTKEALVNDQGKASFSELEPGIYSASYSHGFSTNGKGFNLNGWISGLEVLKSKQDTLQVTLSASGTLLIKEIYFAGCLTPAGANYNHDQFIEIYNNSNARIYADGLSILEHESYADSENNWDEIKDSIVVKTIWTIPGSGKDVPIEPGQGIVIAQDGIDHRFDDSTGIEFSPVDLSIADFEFFMDNARIKDTDFIGVPNLEENFSAYRGNDFVMFTRGGSALALAYLPGKTKEERITNINKHLVAKQSASGANTTYVVKIPNKLILDAVEVVKDIEHAIYKRFPSNLDAGYVFPALGSASGKSIRRRVDSISSGRVVYLDSNNSTLDFFSDVDPKPGVYEE